MLFYSETHQLTLQRNSPHPQTLSTANSCTRSRIHWACWQIEVPFSICIGFKSRISDSDGLASCFEPGTIWMFTDETLTNRPIRRHPTFSRSWLDKSARVVNRFVIMWELEKINAVSKYLSTYYTETAWFILTTNTRKKNR